MAFSARYGAPSVYIELIYSLKIILHIRERKVLFDLIWSSSRCSEHCQGPSYWGKRLWQMGQCVLHAVLGECSCSR
jgi:hypothetical protein